jgi:membrane-associated HD superfamily phosphohydrolase
MQDKTGVPIHKDYSERFCIESFLRSRGEDPASWNIYSIEDREIDKIAEKGGIVIKTQIRFLEDDVVKERAVKGLSVGSRNFESLLRQIIKAVEDKQKYEYEITKDALLLLYASIDIHDLWLLQIKQILEYQDIPCFKEIFIVWPPNKSVKIK